MIETISQTVFFTQILFINRNYNGEQLIPPTILITCLCMYFGFVTNPFSEIPVISLSSANSSCPTNFSISKVCS